MKSKVIIHKRSFTARVALIMIILAIPFIVIGKFSLLSNFAPRNIPLVTEVFLPLIGCMLFALSIVLLGRLFFAISFLPVVLCMIPIVLLSLKLGTAIGIVEVVICFLTIIIYTCTVFGAIQKKVFSAIAFVIEIAFRLYFHIYLTVSKGATFGVQEAFYHVAIIFMLTSFLFAVFALDRKVKIASTGKEVIPPMPGSDTIGQTSNPTFSDPAPVRPTENIASNEADADSSINGNEEPIAEENKTEEISFTDQEDKMASDNTQN